MAEVQRKSLADRFSCVPSQINYVIETRFTPEHGYLVESQRGGGGYIRIVRLLDDKQRTLLEAARGIGGRLTQNDAARLTRALVSAEPVSYTHLDVYKRQPVGEKQHRHSAAVAAEA